MTIDPASGLILWTPGLSQAGTYTVTLHVRDTANLSNTQSLALIVLPANYPPVVQAFPVLPITLPAAGKLVGGAVDDGNPAGSTLSYNWSEVSGPGTVSFSNPTALTTTASFSNAGTYDIRLTANDTQLSGSEDITIVVNSPAGVPAIVSVNPNTGQQGQQNLSVAITGQNTNSCRERVRSALVLG